MSCTFIGAAMPVRPKRLGAIIAGGKSRRFGSDKALAEIDGQPLIDRVISALAPLVDEIVICGRDWRSYTCLPDRPQAAIGPLGGLAAAFHYGQVHGFAGVLTAPVDALHLPADVLARLTGHGSAYLAQDFLVGYWARSVFSSVETHLETAGNLSVRGWMDTIDAASISGYAPVGNANRPSDFRDFSMAVALQSSFR